MSATPFLFGQTVDGQHFTNRVEEIRKIENNLTNGIHTVIMSPRRWGKSSLVEKTVKKIVKKDKKVKAVFIDLFAVGTEKEFLELFAKEVLNAASGKLEEQIKLAKGFFKKLIPKISFSTDPNSEFSISFDIKELKDHVDEILNLPEKLAQKKNIRIIVCIDEFQNLTSFTSYSILERKMRAAWQRHKAVSYCLYGSKKNLLETIFNNTSKPFYRFGDTMFLYKISAKEWVKYICKRFDETSKKISESQALTIANKMKNHPWYVQQLAHYIWNRTIQIVSSTNIDEGVEEVIRVSIPFFQKETQNLSVTQINLLRSILLKETKFTSVDVMEKYLLGTPNNVTKNKKKLLEMDLILEMETELEFTDPVFEIWFSRNYLSNF